MSGASGESLRLSRAPATRVGMLIRRPARDVFAALTDPALTTRFWFTKSSGPVTRGAELTWTWEMYEVSSAVSVTDVEEDRLLASPGAATTRNIRPRSSSASSPGPRAPTSRSPRPGSAAAATPR